MSCFDRLYWKTRTFWNLKLSAEQAHYIFCCTASKWNCCSRHCVDNIDSTVKTLPQQYVNKFKTWNTLKCSKTSICYSYMCCTFFFLSKREGFSKQLKKVVAWGVETLLAFTFFMCSGTYMNDNFMHFVERDIVFSSLIVSVLVCFRTIESSPLNLRQHPV